MKIWILIPTLSSVITNHIPIFCYLSIFSAILSLCQKILSQVKFLDLEQVVLETYIISLKFCSEIAGTFFIFLMYLQSGILRFCGPTEFAPGMWAGIELDEAAGKNDGSIQGISYFECPPMHGNLS